MDRLARLLTTLRTLVVASLATGAAIPAAHAQSSKDEGDWLAARADGSRRGFERYLQRNPTGRHASEAFVNIARMSVDPGWTPPLAGEAEPLAGPTGAEAFGVY